MVVRCYAVTPQYDLPVTIDNIHGVPTIIGMDVAAALDFTGGRPGANVGAHAWLHNRLGPDPIYITGLQFLPLQCRPTAPVSMAVTVEQGSYRWQNVEKIWEEGNSGSLTSYVPGSAAVNHFVIICLDRANNAIVIVDGDDIDATSDPFGLMPGVLTAADVLAVTIADAYYPLAAIVLYNGMDAVRASDIVMDLRLWGGEGGLNGDVTGPGSATDNAIARFDGTTGKAIQNSAVTISDDGAVLIDPTADAVQLTVQGHSTQTNPILLAETSAGTDLLTLSNAGQLALPTTGSGGGVRIGGDVDLYRGAADQLNVLDSVAVALSQNGVTKVEVSNTNAGSSARSLFRLISDTITADLLAFPAAAAGGARTNFQSTGGPFLIVTSGGAYAIDFYTNLTLRFTVDGAGNVVVGTGALATNATDGFLYIPTCAGAPTGTPTAKTGRVPIVFNTTDNKLHVYDGGWLATVALT
jgi:hypothetical protein